MRDLRIVVLIGVRNEELYLSRCLEHLLQQGLEVCVIDNESSDRTLDILEEFRRCGGVRIEHLPWRGAFELAEMLRLKEALARKINADWFLHHDVDEIREATPEFSSLKEGLAAADADGFNAVNFDEFVFVPTNPEDRFEHTDYRAGMRRYYFFEPFRRRRVNAWKKTDRFDLVTSAGHVVQFADQRLAPVSFDLRHYIFLSAEHARSKYGENRHYSQEAIDERGWHRERARWGRSAVRLPRPTDLQLWDGHSLGLDRSSPKTKHLFSFDPI
jgi:glycosyltransferase involved in cell wall biosynthesis